ncbi:peptide chain release factor N(5)-glutamine methyltransferase [Sorangium sp. So ce1182]|uniref:peptide chain release factor N(5)-glutamine methyltransferase n=1 Tax=Sorangium sp. So ce1182 TaxID=3133334 RepID=UPI003F626812
MTKPDVDPQNEAWTIRRVIAWASGDLKKRGASSARLDAELLLGKVLGIDRVGLLIDGERPLDRAELAAYRALHQRRRAGEPVAYLLGVREFYGRPFRVDPRVLIPRPDTEILVEVGLARTRRLALSARVLDLCTGSGCVAVSLACERPTGRVLGVDISDGALAVARENALRLGAVNAGFLRADLFAGVPPGLRFDLITANPPYIPDEDVAALQIDIRGYEPHLALAGGADGLSFTRRIVAGAPAWLARGGALALEVEAGKAGAVAELLAAAGFVEVARNLDYGGHERVVSGVLP